MTETPIDHAHGAMMAAPGDSAAELAFYGQLAGSELYLLLEAPSDGETVEPRVFPLDEGNYVLAYDREARLAEFAGAAPYAALSGRALAGMLAGQGIGVGLNLDVAPSAILLPPGAIDWLAERATTPVEVIDQPLEIAPPRGVTDGFLQALDSRLAAMAGLGQTAYLVSAGDGLLLAFTDVVPGAEPAIAQSMGEILAFLPDAPQRIDVAFPGPGSEMAEVAARQGLRFDLPKPSLPGRDPGQPPKLR